MLEVRDVVKSYDGHVAVDHVSFEVQPGEIFALLGPNGAGKTTLLRMITDILKPDSGTILLDGQPVGGESRQRVAYLPEERGLYRRTPVAEALALYGRLKGLSAGAARSAALALLDRVELREWAAKQVQTLSKGMQQKVQLCTALIGEPRLLILDEPFTGLDPLNTQLFEEILAERRAAGVTVLLSTHQMNKVEEQCDRALMINRGRMVLYGSVHDIRRRHAGHAVLVRSERRPEAVHGVERVEAVDRQGTPLPATAGAGGAAPAADGSWRLTLEPAATPQAVLAELIARGLPVESFSIATQPLEDIFVKVVREGLGLDHGESGPPTVDQVVRGGAR